MAPTSSSSSLMSVHDVAAAVRQGRARTRLASAVPASASGVVTLPRDAIAPVLAPTPLPPIPPQPIAPPSNRAGWAMVGVLGAVLAGLGFVVVNTAPPTVIVRTEAAAPPPAATTPAAVAMPTELDEPVVEPDPEPEPEPEPVVARPKPTTTTKPKPKTPPKTDAPREPVATGQPKPPAKNASGMPSVECVLDPSKCDAGKSTTDTSKKPKADPLPTDLPDKLTAAQLRTGLATIKPAAKQCGRQFGIAAGTSVKLKLSIAGDSGRVVGVGVLDEHAGTPLASCLVDVVKQVELPRFTKSRMGTLYTLRL